MDVLNNENQEFTQEQLNHEPLTQEQELAQTQTQAQEQELAQTQDRELWEKELPLIFPETDYKKDGSLKKVRGRVLRKLFKYEFRAYAPVFYILLAVLSALTLLVCLFVRFDVHAYDHSFEFNQAVSVFMIMAFALYLFTLFFFPLVIFGLSTGRYNNNFFKDEGYLTFSVPASMEEHVLAKHLCAILLTLASALASFISFILFLSVSIDASISLTPDSQTNVLMEIESILLFATSFIGSFFVVGALQCWAQKFVKKRGIFFRFLIFYFALVLLESVFALFDFTAVGNFFASEAGAHISAWLGILLSAVVSYFSYRYEVKFLKTKLNLK